MAVTAEGVRRALSAVGAVGGQMRSFEELASGANEALAQAPSGLTQEGAAAFLATMAQESAWFRTTEEYSKNGRYAPYIGRTFQQVTWKDNYRSFGVWCKSKGLLSDSEAFVKSPKSLADYKWAWLGGVWYFEFKNIWPYANQGKFLAVQKTVNLGSPTSPYIPVGYSTRLKAYNAFKAIPNLEEDMPLTDADVKKVAAEVVKQLKPLIPTAEQVAKEVISGDNVPAPKTSPTLKTNPTWNLHSYLQNIHDAVKKKV